MKRVGPAIAGIVFFVSCLVGCSGSTDVTPPSSSASTAPEVTTSSSEVEGGSGEAAFVWQPDLGHEYGSDVANRDAYGLLDGEGGMLYFQAFSRTQSTLVSLWALSEATGAIEELAPDCGGMINVIDDAVFYIGDASPGVYRYDTRTERVSTEYEGHVRNLLATDEYLYIINVNLVKEECELCELELAGGGLRVLATNVFASYLEYIDGYVYFAQMDPDEYNCRLCKIAVGSPGQVATVYDGIESPLKMLGTRVLYGTSTSVRLIDIYSGEDTELYRWDMGAGVNGGPPAANGNGIFYGTMDKEGYAELCVFDLESERTSVLMPVHGGAVCFVDGEIYLVNAVNLDIERVILDPSDPHTELVVRGDPQAR